MLSIRIAALSLAGVVMSPTMTSAQDLSKYRDFQLGTSLAAVAHHAGIGSEPRVLHQRPELIEELMWQPPRVLGSLPQGDSVKKVLFRFYNGKLFRMVISYERDRTEGLTADDMVEAISATYGLTILPSTEIAGSMSGESDNSRQVLTHWEDSRYSLNLNYDDKILARWDDAEYSVHLFRSPYLFTYGLVLFSKPLDTLARLATVEADRLDAEEAPQREVDRQQEQTEENRVKQEKARQANKVSFRQ